LPVDHYLAVSWPSLIRRKTLLSPPRVIDQIAARSTWVATVCSETRRKYVHVGLCAASLRPIVSEQTVATHVCSGRPTIVGATPRFDRAGCNTPAPKARCDQTVRSASCVDLLRPASRQLGL